MTGSINPTLPSKGEDRGTADAFVKGSLVTLRNGLNAILNSENKVITADGAYRALLTSTAILGEETASGLYAVTPFVINPKNPVEQAKVVPQVYLDDADGTVESKTQKLRLRVHVDVNTVKPTHKFTFGLYPITSGGVSLTLVTTLGSVVSGSTVEVNEPAASSVATAVSSDFTVPSDGAYALGCVTSAKMTEGTAVALTAQLQTRWV